MWPCDRRSGVTPNAWIMPQIFRFRSRIFRLPHPASGSGHWRLAFLPQLQNHLLLRLRAVRSDSQMWKPSASVE